MESRDFAIPSPKRRRTSSPEENREQLTENVRQVPTETSEVIHSHGNSSQKDLVIEDNTSTSDIAIPGLSAASMAGDNAMLDALMLHVESESQPVPDPTIQSPSLSEDHSNTSVLRTDGKGMSVTSLQDADSSKVRQNEGSETHAHLGRASDNVDSKKNIHSVADSQMQDISEVEIPDSAGLPQGESQQQKEITEEAGKGLPPGLPATNAQTVEHLQTVAEVNGVPPTADTLVDEQVPEQREWETDSSPYDSSDTDDSTDSSTSDEEESVEGEYTMMDAMEQARILMQDGGSDDEGERSTNRGAGVGLRTANERPEEIMPKPDVTVTPDMVIEELGHIENIVEGIVLVKAKVSGEYQVLESGSVLCLEDRSVIGVISETLGRVEQPLYTVRFGSDTDIRDSGVSVKGTKIFYVQQHSTFVFTQPLKAVKGSDASNVHDEEIDYDEMEFSDDEAEAEHKRMLKLKRKEGDPSTRGRGSGRGGRGSHRGGRGGLNPSHGWSEANGSAYGNGSLEISYDDAEDGETEYTPLQRPTNLHEMMGHSQPVESSTTPSFSQPRRGGRGRDRGRDRGSRGFHGGGHRVARGGKNFQSNYNNPAAYSQNTYQGSMPPPQVAFATPPPPPALTPQNSAGLPNTSFSPSPISPLPRQEFNFPSFGGNAGGYQQQQSPSVALNNQFQQMWQSWQAQQPQFQQQQQGWNNGAAYQYQQGQNVSGGSHPYPGNADSSAQVQRHLEELRRGSAENSRGRGA